MLPSACGICASIARLSSVNSTSPCLDPRAVGEMHADDFGVDAGLIATLAIGVTVPSASMITGVVFLTALATSTGTASRYRIAGPARSRRRVPTNS